MKIGMILDKEFPPDMRVENEAISLSAAGHEVHLLCFSHGSLPSEEQVNNFKVHRIFLKKSILKKLRALINVIPVYDIFWKNKIIRFARKYNIDVLHVHDLYMLGAVYRANKHLRLRIVSDLHENYVEGLKYYQFSTTFPGNVLISIPKWEKTEVAWVKKADAVITTIEEAVNRYVSLGIDSPKIHVVANYVKAESFLQPRDNPDILKKFEHKFIISYAGGFDLHRGLECLIKSMALILKKHPDIFLVLIGQGKNSVKLKNMAAQLHVNENIFFEGWQPPKYIPSYIKASQICLIPHLKNKHTDNTIPHKLFHYMLLKKPVVASNCNPIKRILEETKAGLTFENNNEQQLADAIIQLYEEPELRKDMGENGFQAVKEKYNWETTAQNLIQLYENLNE